MNDDDISLEIKLIEFRKQKALENEIAERAKLKREVLELQKKELLRTEISHAKEVFLSSFKYSIPIGISQMAILKSLVVLPVIHMGIFCYRMGFNKQKEPEPAALAPQ